MAMKKNLIKSRDEYTRYYGDFRGVDFSSDHTQVHQQRLAYLVNMYKDYRSGEGNSLETIPGFRRIGRFASEKINGIHEHNYIDSNGVRHSDIYVHAGSDIYKWEEFPRSLNISKRYMAIPDENKSVILPEKASRVPYIKTASGTVYQESESTYTYDKETYTIRLHLEKSQCYPYIVISYVETDAKPTVGVIGNVPSISFQFNNSLYIMNGNGRIFYVDPQRSANFIFDTYIPYTYKDIDVANTTKPISDYEYEQLNALSDEFKHTYIADGKTTEFYLYTPFTSISEVKAYGESITTDNYNTKDGYIEFKEAPQAPKDKGEAEGYAGIEITAKYDNTDAKSRILKCKIATVFDNRVFLSGNPDSPNTIYYSAAEDPTYFGILNYVTDGVEAAPITAMIPVAETLAVLKSNAKQDGSLYFHTRLETENHIVPVTYPSTRILNGIGCLGAATNFRDDPVFISRMGVEGIAKGIGQFSGKIERAIEHRSSLIDSKLCNLDLSKAQMIEWNGYLIVLCEGCMFMADSRQAYTHESGSMQYEWYYVEGVGFYENQKQEYYFSPILPSEIDKVTIDGVEYKVCLGTDVYDNVRGENVNRLNSPLSLGEYEHVVTNNEYVVINNEYKAVLLPSLDEATQTFKNKAYLCEWRGSYTGGTFHPATIITNIDENIYFGTDNGYVGCFNFDKRDEYGTFAPEWYSFDNRTIYSGCATKMDNCDIPHLTKSTIKKSTVIKTRALLSSAAKIKVRTNNKDYEQVARINTRSFTFDTVDFSDFSFVGRDNTIHSVREKEKHWVEKQHFIYTDEYQKPLSLNYIAFRYKISGRVKG